MHTSKTVAAFSGCNSDPVEVNGTSPIDLRAKSCLIYVI